MEFLSSSFLAEVSFNKNFHGRGLGGFLSSITVYEAMWNCFKKLVRNMATLLCFNCPIYCCLFLLRNYFSDNRDTGQLSPGTTWSWVLIGARKSHLELL